MKFNFVSLSLLLSVVASQTKIDFSSANEAIVDDPYYEVKVGSLEEYNKKLNGSERVSEKLIDLEPISIALDLNLNSVLDDVSLLRSASVPIDTLNSDISKVSIQDMKYHARVAGVAYCNDTVLTSWSCQHCKVLNDTINLYKVLDEPKFQTRAIITINESRKQIILSFRGSVNDMNWFQNLRMTRTRFPIVEGAEVHRGFKDMIDSLQFLFNPAIAKLREDPKYFEYDVVVSGHSLGGALASLAAIYLQQEQVNLPWSKISLFTYEQPRVGNLQFARFLNNVPSTIIRVTNGNDFIPHMPPMFANYRHTFTEVYVDGDRTKICGTEYMEDPSCSNRNVPFLSMNHHNLVWGINLSRGGC